jgi:hypothetical protein
MLVAPSDRTGEERRDHSRFFWIWLLCLIAYISHTQSVSQHSFEIRARISIRGFQLIAQVDLFIVSSKQRRLTHHVDGWGSSRVVVVGGLLVKSPFTAETEVAIFRVAAFTSHRFA